MTNRLLTGFAGGSSAETLTNLYEYLESALTERDSVTYLTPPGVGPAGMIARTSQSVDDVDVVIATSGSTGGTGRLVGLSYTALAASAAATEQRFGGAGQWLTSLPVHHIAGFQVVLRSVLAGIRPASYAGDPHAFATDLAAMRTDVPRYLSVVPTQLLALIEVAPAELASLDAVLVGGAALPAAVAERARAAGIPIVTSYGMTETAGGCVYDGRPLAGVEVRIVDGLVHLSGPQLATRYLDTTVQPFITDHGKQWFVTSDLGQVTDGRLTVLGRADDVIISGGVNVTPSITEQTLSAAFGGQWVVVGTPDDRWGELVTAVSDVQVSLAEVRDATAALPPAYQPRAVASFPLPHLPSGKLDRRAIVSQAAAALRSGAGERR